MSIETYFFVRHGDYRFGDGQGNTDAEEALDRLQELGADTGALVLSSPTERTMNTAAIIAEGLDSEVIPSNRVLAAGESPRRVKNIDNFLALALHEENISASRLGSSLVVVTHSPLVGAIWAKRRENGDSHYGQVLPYKAGSWRTYPSYKVFGRIEESRHTVSLEAHVQELNRKEGK